MDRAHRLGQKRTVHVFRILTKGTIEEEIMGLQKFKVAVAGTIVGQQKIGDDLEQNQHVLDVFSSKNDAKNDGKNDGKDKPMSMAQVLGEAAASTSQATDDYNDFNLDSYLASLKKK